MGISVTGPGPERTGIPLPFTPRPREKTKTKSEPETDRDERFSWKIASTELKTLSLGYFMQGYTGRKNGFAQIRSLQICRKYVTEE